MADTATPQPNFGPALGDAAIAQAAEAFARDGYVRLAGVLAPDAACALHDFLAGNEKWWRVLNLGEKIWDFEPDKVAALEASETGRELHRKVMAAARDGFQYQHDAVRMSDDPAERAGRGLIIDRLLDCLNGPAWLDVFRRVTGSDDIGLVDGQATRYLPGHFLNGHTDDVETKNRVAAYVLGLTPEWRTEWGGLLQFHDAEGDVERGLVPRFNTINLFRVPRMHSVSAVTEFAGAPRLSITGWLRHLG